MLNWMLITALSASPPALPPAPSGAAPEPTEGAPLEYVAPLTCPTIDEMRDGLEALAGAQWSAGRVERVAVIIEGPGEAAEADASFRGEVRITADGEVSRHELHSPSCDTVVRASVLLVAVSVDPVAAVGAIDRRAMGSATDNTTLPVQRPASAGTNASTASDDAERAAASAEAPTAEDPGPAPAEPVFDDERPPGLGVETTVDRVEPARSRRFDDFVLVFGGGGGLGPMPGGAGTVGGALAIRFARARLQLGATHWFARSFDHEDGSGAGASVSVSAGRLLGCYEPRVRDRLSFPLCGGVEAGGAVGRGYGPLQATSREVAPWVAGLGSASVWWRFAGPVALTVAVEGGVGITRPVFDIQGKSQPVVTANRGTFRAFAGLGAHFP